MKNRKRKSLLMTSIVIMLVVWGFIWAQNKMDLFQGLDLYIFILIVLLGIVALIGAIRKDKDEKAGIPVDDELSTLIKYKTGYHSFLISMYLWLFIFILKDKFPDTETMLGGGILLSAAIFYIVRVIIKRQWHGN
jgi:Ca2+/Na+ antiporter